MWPQFPGKKTVLWEINFQPHTWYAKINITPRLVFENLKTENHKICVWLMPNLFYSVSRNSRSRNARRLHKNTENHSTRTGFTKCWRAFETGKCNGHPRNETLMGGVQWTGHRNDCHKGWKVCKLFRIWKYYPALKHCCLRIFFVLFNYFFNFWKSKFIRRNLLFQNEGNGPSD